MYIYIYYYHTSRTWRKHPVSHPSPYPSSRSSLSDEDVGGEDDSEYDAEDIGGEDDSEYDMEDAASMMVSKTRRV
jgi:hypothetical protein